MSLMFVDFLNNVFCDTENDDSMYDCFMTQMINIDPSIRL